MSNVTNETTINQNDTNEWNKLAVELMALNDRMAVVLKRLQQLDRKTVVMPEPKKVILDTKQFDRPVMIRMDKGNSF